VEPVNGAAPDLAEIVRGCPRLAVSATGRALRGSCQVGSACPPESGRYVTGPSCTGVALLRAGTFLHRTLALLRSEARADVVALDRGIEIQFRGLVRPGIHRFE